MSTGAIDRPSLTLPDWRSKLRELRRKRPRPPRDTLMWFILVVAAWEALSAASLGEWEVFAVSVFQVVLAIAALRDPNPRRRVAYSLAIVAACFVALPVLRL